MNIHQKNRLIFGEDYDVPDETVFCTNCGKETSAIKVRVPCEDYDYPRTGMKDAWVSGCCPE